MQSTNRVRKKYFLLLAICLLAVGLAACGKTNASEKDEESRSARSHRTNIEEESAANGEDDKHTGREGDEDTDKDTDAESDAVQKDTKDQKDTSDQKVSGKQTVDPLPELTEAELAALQYVEKTVLDDYYGDKTEYEIYVPKDALRGEGYISFIDHGLHFFVSVINAGFDDLLDEFLNSSVQYDIDSWEDESSGYSEVVFGEMVRCGDDRFRIASAMSEDFYGTPYAVKKIYFMDVLEEGVGVLWTLEVSELGADDETNVLIDEISKCYRVDLEEIKAGSTWLVGDTKRKEQRQDEYEPSEGELVLEKVEGYQYMGLAMITDYKGEVQCPIMIPMGWQTRVREDSARAHMHGIQVSGSFGSLYGRDYLSNVQSNIDNKIRTYENLSDTYANAQAGSAQPIPGYDMARCAVITYEEKDYSTEEFLPRVDVACYIKVQEDYVLYVTITLLFEEYDDSTNILLKELETAYGIDLSEYYYEKV